MSKESVMFNKTYDPPDPRPVSLILDTDMGNDIDDALALGMIHALESNGECRLLGVLSSKDNPYSPVYIDVVNTFYGRGDIPIGIVRDGVTPDDRTFIREVSSARNGDRLRYKRTHQPDGYEDAVPLLRRLLAAEPDHSVVLVMIGFSTNLAQLMLSVSDEHSPLNGQDLLAKKVRRVVAMAGNFDPAVQANPTMDNREYNIHCDIPAAMRFFNGCPAPVTFCGYEVGFALQFPCQRLASGFAWASPHPVAEAYEAYLPMPYDRPLWDPATVLEAVHPGAGYFGYSPAGRVRVDEQGIALFHEADDGPQRYLTLSPDRMDQTLNKIVDLCVQPVKPRVHTTVRIPSRERVS